MLAAARVAVSPVTGWARPDVATGGGGQGFTRLAGSDLSDHWEVADYAKALAPPPEPSNDPAAFYAA
ncbi:hypothetical protein [Salipiger thiooxidans]|uniref:hypothetical protein n=1 Tax=Salipiger thiooxidans TaxID=282683 RepID=UPI001CFB0866|nr:hypothetical protein [Salipiger thiooxidans]